MRMLLEDVLLIASKLSTVQVWLRCCSYDESYGNPSVVKEGVAYTGGQPPFGGPVGECHYGPWRKRDSFAN